MGDFEALKLKGGFPLLFINLFLKLKTLDTKLLNL